jgi:pteridine reductase
MNIHSELPLLGKSVFITGAARRLGKSITLTAARLGADLVLHFGKSSSEIDETAKEVKKMGRSVTVVQGDLTNSSQVTQLIDSVITKTSLYALINNASSFLSDDLQSTSLDSWNSTLQTNLTSPFIFCKHFAANYQLQSVGRIINLLDWRALRPGKDHFAYTISKAALAAMTKSLALSLAPAITVNAIALGAILPPEVGPENPAVLLSVPMNRWANLSELAKIIQFFLCGPETVTGEIIHLDGGRHLFH